MCAGPVTVCNYLIMTKVAGCHFHGYVRLYKPLFSKKTLEIPCGLDEVNNHVEEAYVAKN